MATKSVIVRNEKRKTCAAKYGDLRKKLVQQMNDCSLSPKERIEARRKLNKLPRDSAGVRVMLRCSITGRARGVYRFCGLSRIELRLLALSGMLPGVRKSSW